MTNLAPEHPKGCPIAIAPPCILTLFSGIFNFFIQYIACPANASFISNKSISFFEWTQFHFYLYLFYEYFYLILY